MHIHKDINIEYVNRVLSERNYSDGTYKQQIPTNESHLCNLVKIPISDPRVYFAQRGNRRTVSPMVNFADLKPNEYHYTNIITVIFKVRNGKIDIKTVYWGEGNAPCEPHPGREDYQECLNFWVEHALIPDEKITKRKPSYFYKPYINKQ